MATVSLRRKKKESSLLLRKVLLLQQEKHGLGTRKAVQIGQTVWLGDAIDGKGECKAEGSRKEKVNFWPQRNVSE